MVATSVPSKVQSLRNLVRQIRSHSFRKANGKFYSIFRMWVNRVRNSASHVGEKMRFCVKTFFYEINRNLRLNEFDFDHRLGTF